MNDYYIYVMLLYKFDNNNCDDDDGKIKNESVLIFLCINFFFTVFRRVYHIIYNSMRIQCIMRLWPEIIESKWKRKVAKFSTHGKTITQIPRYNYDRYRSMFILQNNKVVRFLFFNLFLVFAENNLILNYLIHSFDYTYNQLGINYYNCKTKLLYKLLLLTKRSIII